MGVGREHLVGYALYLMVGFHAAIGKPRAHAVFEESMGEGGGWAGGKGGQQL